MPETTITRSARGLSPLLLVLAALCFLLPFAAVSCNTGAGSAALGGAISQLGGPSTSGGNAAASCLQALNGRDLVTYTGIDMLTGSDPSTATAIPGCGSSTSSPASASSPGGIGVQPLLVAVLVLIVAGVVAAVLPARSRFLAGGGAALVAAVLVLANNAAVHGTVLDRITRDVSRQGGSSLSTFGLNASLGTFFDVHAGIGFVLILVVLVAAIAVNAAAQMSASRPPPVGPAAVDPTGPWPPPGPAAAPPPGPPASPA